MTLTGPALEANNGVDQVDKASYAHRPTGRPLPAWPTALLASTSTAMVATGAVPLLAAAGSEAAAATAAVGALVSAGVVTATVCHERRLEIAASAQASMERVAGPVHRFRVRRWRGGLVGVPQLVRFRYQPAAVVANKAWPGAGAAVLASVLGAKYRVSRHDPRLGRITLRLTVTAPTEAPSVEIERATTMMQLLFGQTASVQASSESAALTRVVVQHECGVKATFPQWRERVERVVTTMLEGRWRARWNLRTDTVTFELRPQIDSLIPRPAPSSEPEMASLIPLGVDEDGQVTSWDMHSSLPHFLISGKTGKGKTNVLRGVVMEAALRDIIVWACDPKRVELIGLRGVPNVQIVATTVEEQVVTVLQAWELMEERYSAITDGASEDEFDLLMLVIDEFAEFSRRVSQWWARIKTRGMPATCPVMEKFDSLVRLGRTAGIRVAIGIQRPDVRFFGESGEARDNFDARLSLGRLSADGSRMMWGSSIGTSLPGVRGRAIACTSDDNAVEIQTYWVPDPRRSTTADERELLQQLCPSRPAKYPPLHITIPEPAVDSKGVPDVWGSIVDAVMEPNAEADYAQYEPPTEPEPTGEGPVPRDDAQPPPNRPAVAAQDDENAGEPEGRSATIVAFPHGRRPRRATAGLTRGQLQPPAPPRAGPPVASPPLAGDDDPLADYGPPTTVTPDEITDGELLELDPDRWVVVESVEQDFANDQEWIVSWRSIDPGSDDSGSVMMPGEATARCRAMSEDEEL